MIKVGDEKIYPSPQAKNWFLAKKGVKNSKISQKLNQVGLSSNFQGSSVFWNKTQTNINAELNS